MRILKSFIVFLSVFFLLCACTIKSDNQMTITEDGKMDYSVLIAFDNEVIECLNILESQGNNTDSVLSVDDIVNKSIKDSYLDGFNEEKYTDEDFVGNKYTYRVDNIDSISTDKKSIIYLNEKSDSNLTEQKLFKKRRDIYTANFVYSLENKNLYDNVDFKNTFVVSLPFKNLNNNADEVKDNGKTLIWHIKNGEKKKINFKFKLYENKNAFISIGSIVIDFFLISIFVFVYTSRKRVL